MDEPRFGFSLGSTQLPVTPDGRRRFWEASEYFDAAGIVHVVGSSDEGSHHLSGVRLVWEDYVSIVEQSRALVHICVVDDPSIDPGPFKAKSAVMRGTPVEVAEAIAGFKAIWLAALCYVAGGTFGSSTVAHILRLLLNRTRKEETR